MTKHSRLLLLSIALFSFTLQSCFLFGIKTRVSNPKRAGTYPEFSGSLKQLGNQDSRHRTCYDVTHYLLDVVVDEKKKSLRGSVEMLAVTTKQMDTLQMDLYENMKVNSISVSRLMSFVKGSAGFTSTTYTRKHGGIFIPLTMKAGEIFCVRVEYEGKPKEAPKPPWKGGFVWKTDKEKNPWIGVACESEGASIWWPCKDVTNDEPDSMDIHLTVSKPLVGVANGHLRSKEEKENTTTYKWHVSYPINLYNVSIYVGNYKLLSDSYTMPMGKTLSINHYVLPYNYEKAKTHLQQAKPQLSFFERTFGEYPWYKDGYKLVESPYEGMEHQTAIAYGAGYKNSYMGFDYIILHETAHEWWGNSLTASDLADVWLQEGFATYAEALYVEKTQGREAYMRYLLTYRLFINNKRPVVGPRGARFFDYKDSDVYMKGAWVLHSLRNVINNEPMFFNILNTFHDNFSKKTVTSQDLIDLVNQKTAIDHKWFFDQYLYKREAPMLEHYWDGENFFYRWKGVNSDFKMDIEIALDDVIVSIQPTTSVQKLAVSKNTYKGIYFNNFKVLFGTSENKKITKRNTRVTGTPSF